MTDVERAAHMAERLIRPLPQPEPGLTPEVLIARAAALKPLLREQQAENDARGSYSDEIHQAFEDAGFYRILCLPAAAFVAQAMPCCAARARRLLRVMAPSPPKPVSIIAQVAGSGVGTESVTGPDIVAPFVIPTSYSLQILTPVQVGPTKLKEYHGRRTSPFRNSLIV